VKWLLVILIATFGIAACITQTVTVDSTEPVNCVKKSQTILLSHVECTSSGGKVLKD